MEWKEVEQVPRVVKPEQCEVQTEVNNLARHTAQWEQQHCWRVFLKTLICENVWGIAAVSGNTGTFSSLLFVLATCWDNSQHNQLRWHNTTTSNTALRCAGFTSGHRQFFLNGHLFTKQAKLAFDILNFFFQTQSTTLFSRWRHVNPTSLSLLPSLSLQSHSGTACEFWQGKTSPPFVNNTSCAHMHAHTQTPGVVAPVQLNSTSLARRQWGNKQKTKGKQQLLEKAPSCQFNFVRD